MREFICRGAQGHLDGVPDALAALLIARGADTPEKARAFLHPSPGQLTDPLKIFGAEEACALLRACVKNGRQITVYGDYDCDGVCACTILRGALSALGARVRVYIPDRHREGYGLNESAVRDIAQSGGCLITADCGVTNAREVALARALGLTVIVTDHHALPETLPDAHALMHPALGEAHCPDLCGAGVAWKLACALRGETAWEDVDLAALATIADMVPLTGENRAIAALGLQAMADTRRIGLRALMRVAGMRPGEAVTSEQAAFLLAPRVNACGRMESADIALALFSAQDAQTADALAARAEALNARRKAAEGAILRAAEEQALQMDLYENCAIVVAGEGWESGVVGLAAGRLAEKYGYPAVVLSSDGETSVGSARSAGGIDLYAALRECAGLFTRFGGHKQAAGLTLKSADIDELRARLSDAVKTQLGGRALMPRTVYDAELRLSDVTVPFTEQLLSLSPFGMGNPAPVFLIRGADALACRAIGADQKHLRLSLLQDGAAAEAVAFGMGARAGAIAGECTLAVSLQINSYRGRRTAECRVEALECAGAGWREDTNAESLSILQELNRLCRINEGYAQPAPPPDDAPACGALYVCRTAQTARAVLKAHPGLDIALDGETEPRAYGAVWLCGALTARGPYRQVILCDGALCPGEIALARQLYPLAEVRAMPRSQAIESRLAALQFSKDALRACYRRARAGDMPDLRSPKEAAMALALCDMNLLALAPCARLLPMIKCGPESSPLARLLLCEGGNA